MNSTTMLAPTTIDQSAAGQDASADFAGSWLVTAQPDSRHRAMPLRMLMLCNRDGDVIASRPLGLSERPAGSLFTTPGQGAWHATDSGEVSMTALLYWQSTPGNPAVISNLVGVETLRMNVKLDASGNAWQGALLGEVRDPAGKTILATRRGSVQATRLRSTRAM